MPALLRLPVLLVVVLSVAYALTVRDRDSAAPEEAFDGAPLPSDPLPPGALVRLGTNRLRSPHELDRVLLSPDAKLLVTNWDHSSLAVWDAQTGLLLRTIEPLKYKAEPRFQGDDREWLTAEGMLVMAFEARTGKFHALTYNGNLRACDLTTGAWSEPLARATLLPGYKWGERLAYGIASPDGTHFAYVSPVDRFETKSKRVEVLAVGRGEPLYVLDADKLGDWFVRDFTDDNQLVGIDRNNTPLAVNWNLAAGEKSVTYAGPGDEFMPVGVTRAPDKRTVAVVYAARFEGKSKDTVDPWRNWPLYVYDADTGKERLRVPEWKGHAAGYTRDGSKIVGIERNEAFIADAATGQVTARLSGHKFIDFPHFAFSADGKHFVTVGGRDRSAIIWDLTTGKPALDFDAPRGPVQTIVFSPDGKTVFTATAQESTSWLWDAATGKRKHSLAIDGKGMPQTAAFTPDGKYLVAGYGFGPMSGGNRGFPVRVWRVSDGKLIREIGDHTDGVQHLVLSPDGKQLATRAYSSKNVRLWEFDTGALSREIAWIEDYDTRFTYSDAGDLFGIKPKYPNGNEAVNLATGHRIAHWQSHQMPHPHTLSPDGRLIASRERRERDGNDQFVIRKVATGSPVCALPPTDVSHLSSVAFSHDGTTVAVAPNRFSEPDTNTVYLFDTTTGKQLRTIRAQKGSITALAFSPDGTRLATGSADTTVLIWDLTAKP